MALADFVRESNAIEGIYRDPTDLELIATGDFLKAVELRRIDILVVQKAYAPDHPLRNEIGMNVRVGQYIAPLGGPKIATDLDAVLQRANKGIEPWRVHVEFERLHPFMDGNGRTGRVLWVWCMLKSGQDPFALSFLHRFYYQTLKSA